MVTTTKRSAKLELKRHVMILHAHTNATNTKRLAHPVEAARGRRGAQSRPVTPWATICVGIFGRRVCVRACRSQRASGETSIKRKRKLGENQRNINRARRQPTYIIYLQTRGRAQTHTRGALAVNTKGAAPARAVSMHERTCYYSRGATQERGKRDREERGGIVECCSRDTQYLLMHGEKRG